LQRGTRVKPRKHCGLCFGIDLKGGTVTEDWCILPARPKHRMHLMVRGVKRAEDITEEGRQEAIAAFEKEMAKREKTTARKRA